MRVAHVIPDLDPRSGGPIMSLLGMAAAQVRAGLEVTVVSTVREGEQPLDQQLRAAGVRVEIVGPVTGKLRRHPQIIPALRRVIPTCDIVHVQAVWEEIQHQASVIAAEHGKPEVRTPHGMLDPWSLRQSRWLKKLYMLWRLDADLRRAAAIHCTSETERRLLAPLALRDKAIVVPNGLDIREFENLPPRGAFRARHPELAGRPVVLFMSRLHYKKGLDVLIPAFAAGAPRQAMLVVAGPADEEYLVEVEAMVRRNGLASRTIFTGMLRGVERIAALVDAELFVLPSYQENFGIVVIEALAAGCPVVISDQVNIHQEITAAGLGGVVPVDSSAVAQEIARWMADRPLRESVQQKGPVYVREHFDWDVIARRWADEYRRVLS